MSTQSYRFGRIAGYFFLLFISTISYAQERQTVNYFVDGIRQEFRSVAPASPPFKSFNFANLAEERALVWADWKKANESTDKGQLPELSSIEDPKAYSWKLKKEDPMPFLYVRKGNKPAEGFPLVINLHGSGPKETEWSNIRYISAAYPDSPSVYFLPQIPSEERYRWWYVSEQEAWEKLFRLAMLSPNINPNKIYFTGISEGAYGSQRLGAFYADYLAGAGPIAGGEPLENAPPLNYRNTAFAFETGEMDSSFGRNSYTKQAKLVFDSLAAANPHEFVHQINLQLGRGHHVDYNKVMPWLINYIRNPYPKHVSWVNFPMHKRYRKGFYNLAVLKPFNVVDSADVDRTIFDLKIDSTKNTLFMTANTLNYKTGEKGKISKGKIGIYLCQELVDMKRPVRLFVNKKQVFSGRLKINRRNLIESCLLFGDPKRLYPALITVDFQKI